MAYHIRTLLLNIMSSLIGLSKQKTLKQVFHFMVSLTLGFCLTTTEVHLYTAMLMLTLISLACRPGEILQ